MEQIIKKEKVLLTDFNAKRWEGIDMKSVEKCLIVVKEKANEKRLIGENVIDVELFNLGYLNNNMFDTAISLSNAICMFENIMLENNCIYGDVILLKNKKYFNTEQDMLNLLDLINKKIYEFRIRVIGNEGNIPKYIEITKIITWDLYLNEK